jgi:hypothetical protein
MNVWAFCLSLSIFIWELVFNRSLLLVHFIVTLFYFAGHYLYKVRSDCSIFTKMKIAMWNDSGDPTIGARLEVDLEPIDQLLDQHNAKHPNNRVTYTAVFAKALGEGIAHSRTANGKVVYSTFQNFSKVNFLIPVNLNGNNLTAVLLEDVSSMSIRELNDLLKKDVKVAKTGKQEDFNLFMQLNKYIPYFVIQGMTTFFNWWIYDMGMSISALKIKHHPYGFGVLTNLSDFGIHNGCARLIGPLKTLFGAAINTPYFQPVVVGSEIKIRKILSLYVGVDSRVADISEASLILNKIQEVLKNPMKYL